MDQLYGYPRMWTLRASAKINGNLRKLVEIADWWNIGNPRPSTELDGTREDGMAKRRASAIISSNRRKSAAGGRQNERMWTNWGISAEERNEGIEAIGENRWNRWKHDGSKFWVYGLLTFFRAILFGFSDFEKFKNLFCSNSYVFNFQDLRSSAIYRKRPGNLLTYKGWPFVAKYKRRILQIIELVPKFWWPPKKFMGQRFGQK